MCLMGLAGNDEGGEEEGDVWGAKNWGGYLA